VRKIDLNKVNKVITVLTIMWVIISFSSIVFGDILDPGSVKSVASDGSKKVGDFLAIVLGIVQTIAMAVAVIMLAVLAIKYFTSSAQDKAEIKKSAIAYVLGAVLLFGGVWILNIIKGAFGAGTLPRVINI